MNYVLLKSSSCTKNQEGDIHSELVFQKWRKRKMKKDHEKERQMHLKDTNDVTVDDLQNIRINTLLKQKNSDSFVKLFEQLGIDIISLWGRGYTLAVLPNAWQEVPLKKIKKIKENNSQKIKRKIPECPICGKRKLYERMNVNPEHSFICYNCKNTFSKQEIGPFP